MAIVEYNRTIIFIIVLIIGFFVFYKLYGGPKEISIDKASGRADEMEKKTSAKPRDGADKPSGGGDKTALPSGYKRMTDKTSGTWLSGKHLVPMPVVDVVPFAVTQHSAEFKFNKADLISFTLKAEPVGTSKGDILLLHGSAFSASTWNDKTDTLRTMAALGYTAYAFDLPGRGKAKPTKADQGHEKDFLKELIKQFGVKSPVIISASYSGKYSLPYMIDGEDCRGFVSVATVNGGVTAERAKKIKVPSMLIYGEKDSGQANSVLKNIPNVETFRLDDARHPAYLDQPKAFNFLIYNFMRNLKS